MSNDSYGFELPLLLFGGFRSIIDELHAELARRGHPDVRPAHGLALQAVGLGGGSASPGGRGPRRSPGWRTWATCPAPATPPPGGASWPASPRAASRCWPCPR